MPDFLTLKEASKHTGYHQDYLGQLIRDGKIEARKIGKSWVVDRQSLTAYLSSIGKVVVDKDLYLPPVALLPAPAPAKKLLVWPRARFIVGLLAVFLFTLTAFGDISNFPGLYKFLPASLRLASFSKQINYQGKMRSASTNQAVADNDYTIVFRLYNTLTGGTALWTETQTVTTRNGLFSVALGSQTALDDVNLNQPLYLSVQVGADSEMSPRKLIGAVPSAIVAEQINGHYADEIVFNNSTSTISTSSAQTIITLNQTGAGNIFEVLKNSISKFIIDNDGNVGISTTTPSNKLEVSGHTFLGGNLTATGTLALTPLATPTGSFLAVNASGQVIATTSPLLSYTETDPFYVAASSTILRAGTTTASLTNSTNKNFVTDAHLTVLGNTSGTNTGDNTFGDGLTLTGADVDCDTASDTVFGCLSSANWTTFNNKWDGLNDITLAQGSIFVGNASGNPVATSTLFLVDEKVGIGTTSPTTKLDVNGTVQATDLIVSGGGSITLGGVARNTWPSGGGTSDYWATSSDNLIGYPSLAGNYAIVIGDDATSSPDLKFEVVGNTKLGGNVTATGTLTLTPLATPAGSFLAVNTAGQVIATTTSQFLTSETLYIAASSTLLRAGTTTASLVNSTNKNFVTDAQLTVLGNTSGTNTGDNTFGDGLTLTGSDVDCDTASASVFGCLSTTDWTTFNNKVSSQWTTSGSNIYYNSGNVGIGTTSPSNRLEVSGHTFLGGNLTATGTLAVTGTGTSTITNGLTVDTNTLVVDYANNRVGVGVTAPTQALDVTGTVKSSLGFITREGTYSVETPVSMGGLYSGTSDAYGIYGYRYAYNTTIPTKKIVGVRGIANSFALGVGNTLGWAIGVLGSAGGEYNSGGAIGNVTNAAALYAQDFAPNGALYNKLDNYYGLYLENPTIGTNKWSIYSAGGNNYFGGNVGIGTTSPSSRLEVSGHTFLGGNLTATGTLAITGTATFQNGNIVFDNPTASSSRILVGATVPDNDATSYGAVEVKGYYPGGNRTGGIYAGQLNSVIGFHVGMPNATQQTSLNLWSYGGGIHMRDAGVTGLPEYLTVLSSSGNVGIRNTAPTNQLDIVGTSTNGKTADFAGIHIDNLATSTTASKIKSGIRISSTGTWSGTGSSNIGLYIDGVSGGTNNYDAIFNGGGNVGIGTTSPSSRLEVSGHTFLGGNLTATGTLAVTNTGTSTVAGNLAVDTNVLYVDAVNNRVGMGTVLPLDKLHIASDYSSNQNVGVRFSDSGNNWAGWRMGIKSDAGGGPRFFMGLGGDAIGTDRLTMDTAGKIGIGKTNPSTALDVFGTASSSALWVNGSSTNKLTDVTVYSPTTASNYINRIYNDAPNGGRVANYALTKYVASDSGGPELSVLWTGAVQDTANYYTADYIIQQRYGVSSYRESLRIKGFTGFVGIGTTTPSNRLEVSGHTFLGGNLTATGTLTLPALATPNGSFLAVNASGQVIATTTPSGSSQWTTSGSDIYYTTGRVGIGTTTMNGTLSLTHASTTNGLAVISDLGDLTNCLGDIGLCGDYSDAKFTRSFTFDVGAGLQTEESTVRFNYIGDNANYGTSVNYGIYQESTRLSGVDMNYFGSKTLFGSTTALAAYDPSYQLSVVANSPKINIETAKNGTWTLGEELGSLNFSSDDITGAFAPTEARGRLVAVAENTAGSYTGLAFWTAKGGTNFGVERMRLTNDGYLGIGTTTPAGILNIASTDPKLYITDTNAAANAKHWWLSGSAGNFSVGTASDNLATTATYLTVLSGGNVGIGTTTPATKLDVWGGNTASGITSQVSGSGTSLSQVYAGKFIEDMGTVYLGLYDEILGDYAIYSESGANYFGGAVSLDSTLGVTGISTLATTTVTVGNVGIGTTTPASKLDVWGNFSSTDTNVEAIRGIFVWDDNISSGTAIQRGILGKGTYLSGTVSNTGTASIIGVYGEATKTGGTISGGAVHLKAGNFSSFTNLGTTGETRHFGFDASGSGTADLNFGVSGYALDATANVGIYGSIYGVGQQTYPASGNYAGYFDGNVYVGGTHDLYVPGMDTYSSGAASYVSIVDSTGLLVKDGVAHDFAERMPADHDLEQGDVVVLAPGNIGTTTRGFHLTRATTTYDSTVVGVISAAGTALGEIGLDYKPVGLVGQLEVKVSTENGPIRFGDYLTTSNTPGYAMRATEKSVGIIGQALADFDGERGKILAMVKTSNTLDTAISDGAINQDFWSLDAVTGKIKAIASLDLNNFDLDNVRAIRSASGNWSLGEDGTIKASKLCLGETCLTENELKAILQSANISAAVNSTSASTPTSTPVSTPEPTPETSPEPTLAETPAPTPEPTPEATPEFTPTESSGPAPEATPEPPAPEVPASDTP